MDDITLPGHWSIDDDGRIHIRSPQSLINRLPDELLLKCAAALTEVADICSLRLASRRFAAVGVTRLSTFFTSLCIEPTAQSLARFQEICQHPLFSKGIEYVLYWGLTLHPEVRELEDYRRVGDVEEIIDAYKLSESVIQSAHQDHRTRCQQQKQILDRGLDIAKMRTCLPLLPKLSCMFSDLNPDSTVHALNYPMSMKHVQANRETSASWDLRRERSIEAHVASLLYVADLDSSFQGLGRIPLVKVIPSMSNWRPPVSLHLFLPHDLKQKPEVQALIDSSTFRYSMHCVTSLLVGGGPASRTQATSTYNMGHTLRRIVDSATSLTCLFIRVEDVDDCQEILKKSYIPKLFLMYVLNTFVFCPAGRLPKRILDISPIDSIIGFLLRHRDTLESVTLQYLVGVETSDSPLSHDFSCASPINIAKMRRLLMTQLPRLQHCSLKVELPDGDREACTPWVSDFEIDHVPLYNSSLPYRRLLHDIRAE